ncbi:MAG: hypothetical protein MHM6MM_002892 [Cercozoa sp. M6MM]
MQPCQLTASLAYGDSHASTVRSLHDHRDLVARLAEAKLQGRFLRVALPHYTSATSTLLLLSTPVQTSQQDDEESSSSCSQVPLLCSGTHDAAFAMRVCQQLGVARQNAVRISTLSLPRAQSHPTFGQLHVSSTPVTSHQDESEIFQVDNAHWNSLLKPIRVGTLTHPVEQPCFLLGQRTPTRGGEADVFIGIYVDADGERHVAALKVFLARSRPDEVFHDMGGRALHMSEEHFAAHAIAATIDELAVRKALDGHGAKIAQLFDVGVVDTIALASLTRDACSLASLNRIALVQRWYPPLRPKDHNVYERHMAATRMVCLAAQLRQCGWFFCDFNPKNVRADWDNSPVMIDVGGACRFHGALSGSGATVIDLPLGRFGLARDLCEGIEARAAVAALHGFCSLVAPESETMLQTRSRFFGQFTLCAASP